MIGWWRRRNLMLRLLHRNSLHLRLCWGFRRWICVCVVTLFRRGCLRFGGALFHLFIWVGLLSLLFFHLVVLIYNKTRQGILSINKIWQLHEQCDTYNTSKSGHLALQFCLLSLNSRLQLLHGFKRIKLDSESIAKLIIFRGYFSCCDLHKLCRVF